MDQNTENETKSLTIKDDPEQVWDVDPREIYRRGFSTLTADEKDKVLVSLLIAHGAPNLATATVEELIQVKQTDHNNWKDREEINFKKIVWTVGVVSGVVLIASIVLIASSTGILSDSGNFNAILNVVGAIYQQLFGSIPTLVE